MNGYFHPIYDGYTSRLAQRDCCGGAGPEEVLVIMGPEGTQFTLVMWNGEKGLNGLIAAQEGKGVFGALGIYAPKESVVELQSDTLAFKDPRTKNEYTLKIENVKVADNRYRTICPNWVVFARSRSEEDRSELTPFKWTLQGKGAHGSHMWIDLDTGEGFGNPEEFSITLPSMLINGVEFQPAPVDFIWSPGGYYIYPLNC